MAHTSISTSQVKNFLREQNAPFLFNPPGQEKIGFALALATPGDHPVEKLLSTILHSQPSARILEVVSPFGKDSLKQYREFLSEMFYRLDEPPLRHGQESAAANRLVRILSSRFDYVIIDHAERMGAYSLDLLRRDRGCPAALLVAYDDCILDILISNDTLLKHVYMLS
jgi:hypothetical protein